MLEGDDQTSIAANESRSMGRSNGSILSRDSLPSTKSFDEIGARLDAHNLGKERALNGYTRSQSVNMLSEKVILTPKSKFERCVSQVHITTLEAARLEEIRLPFNLCLNQMLLLREAPDASLSDCLSLADTLTQLASNALEVASTRSVPGAVEMYMEVNDVIDELALLLKGKN
jgi:hypothetical protein